MIVRHRITGKQHTISREQYESQTGAKAVYDVIDDTDYVPEELKGEAVAEEIKDNAPDADSKPADDKPAEQPKKPKADKK